MKRMMIGCCAALAVAVCGCRHYRQCVVLSVETNVAQRVMADQPVVVRAEYRLYDGTDPAVARSQPEPQAIRK